MADFLSTSDQPGWAPSLIVRDRVEEAWEQWRERDTDPEHEGIADVVEHVLDASPAQLASAAWNFLEGQLEQRGQPDDLARLGDLRDQVSDLREAIEDAYGSDLPVLGGALDFFGGGWPLGHFGDAIL